MAIAKRACCFDDCLRRCDSCGVGYSNGKSNPPRIFKNPLENLPAEVRDGVGEAVRGSLHPSKSKWWRIGFDTSEDALTWVVFRHLQLTGQLRSLFARVCPREISANGHEPMVLLWGSPIKAGAEGAERRYELESICDDLFEEPNRRSEPDVIMDFGEDGFVIIEVKFRSDNAKTQRHEEIWRRRYWREDGAFLAPEQNYYQLTRNWRIGWELSKRQGRRFTLLNLVRDDLLQQESKGLAGFAATLNHSEHGSFHPLGWSKVFDNIEVKRDWFVKWTDERIHAIARK